MRKDERLSEIADVCESNIPSIRAGFGEDGSEGSICAVQSRRLAIKDEIDANQLKLGD